VISETTLNDVITKLNEVVQAVNDLTQTQAHGGSTVDLSPVVAELRRLADNIKPEPKPMRINLNGPDVPVCLCDIDYTGAHNSSCSARRS
jgi:hypothetical protein